MISWWPNIISSVVFILIFFRYKGEFSPSFLCCPESFTWQPINQCLPLLDSSAYSRLCPNEEKKDENAFKCIKEVMVLHQRKVRWYSMWKSHIHCITHSIAHTISVGKMKGSMLGPNRVIAKVIKSCDYCCFVRCSILIVRIGECFGPKQAQLKTMHS